MEETWRVMTGYQMEGEKSVEEGHEVPVKAMLESHSHAMFLVSVRWEGAKSQLGLHHSLALKIEYV